MNQYLPAEPAFTVSITAVVGKDFFFSNFDSKSIVPVSINTKIGKRHVIFLFFT